MRKNFLNLIKVIIFSLIIIYGCGKKTDPKPKSSFQIELPKFELKTTEKGIIIKNNSKKYLLIVYKAINVSCPKYELLTKIKPKQEFLDKNNTFGETILYKFVNRMQDYKVFSKPVYAQKIFVIPANIKIKNVKKIGEKRFLVKLAKSHNTKFVIYHSENNQKKHILKDSSLELITDQPTTYYFTPVDKFGIKGKTVKLTIDSKYFENIPAIKNIKVIKRKNHFILFWDATKYKVKIIDPKGKNFIVTDTNFVEISNCGNYQIVLTNGKTEGPATTINPCKF